MHALKTNGQGRRGMASVLAMLFLSLFTVLSMSMAVSSTSNVECAASLHGCRCAHAAAESGLQFMQHQFASMTDLPSTAASDVQDGELEGLWGTIADHLLEMNGTANLQGQIVTVGEPVITLPEIRLPLETGQAYSGFQITITRQTDGRYMTVRSVGRYGNAVRSVEMSFRLAKDTSLLSYAVASRSAMVIASGSEIDGDVYSIWDVYQCGKESVPPYVLQDDCTVDGYLATHETPDAWNENDLASQIAGTYDGVAYNVLRFDDDWSADKFNTQMYKDPEAEIRPGVKVGVLTDLSTIAPDKILKNERWPPKEDGNPREHLDRPLYKNRHFDNIIIPKGYNPQFENCTFDRILYVDCDDNVYRSTSNWREFNPELPPSKQTVDNTLPAKPYWKIGNFWHNSNSWPDTHSNNIVFESCTFNGPVITTAPKDLFWSKNTLYFRGETRFQNEYMPEAAILAPNFNVNIGGIGSDTSDSKLTGLIVGGMVDVRGEAEIEGTVLSTFYPDWDLGDERAYYRTNIGYYDDKEGKVPDEFQGTVSIRPDPNQSLPMGVVSRIVIKPQYGSYSE